MLKEILESPGVVKYPVNTAGAGKTIFQIQDSTLARQMEEWKSLPLPTKEGPKPTPTPGPGGP